MEEDPNDLTILELKSRLTSANVEYNVTEKKKKEYYLDLYKKHVLKQNADETMVDSEDARKQGKKRSRGEESTPDNSASQVLGESNNVEDGSVNEVASSPERKKQKSSDAALPIFPSLSNTVPATTTTTTTTSIITTSQTPSVSSTPSKPKETTVIKTPASTTASNTAVSAPSSAVKQDTRRRKTLTEMDVPKERQQIRKSINGTPRMVISSSSNGEDQVQFTSSTLILGANNGNTPSTGARTTVAIPTTARTGTILKTPKTPSQVEGKQSDPFKSLLLNFLLACIWIALFFAVYVGLVFNHDPNKPPGLPYCNSEAPGTMLHIRPETPCQPCPEHGYCGEGRLLLCEPPFIIKNAICVENEEITTTALNMIDLLQRNLSILAGEQDCYHNVLHSGLFISEIRQVLQYKFVKLDAALYEQSFAKTIKLIREQGPNFQLAIKPMKNTVSTSSNETTTKTSVLEDYIYSTDPILPLQCRIERKFNENKKLILSALGFIALVLLFNYARSVQENNRIQKEDLARTVLTYLKKHKSAVIVHLRDEFSEKYKQINVMKHWPVVEQKISDDSRVSTDTNENGERVWIWGSEVKAPTNY